MLLSDLLRDSAQKYPDKAAMIFQDTRLSFAELDKKSNQVAAHLRSRNIGPGDRVALVFENSPAALIYFWGVLKSGAQNVDIPSLAGRAVVESCLEESKPKALAIQASQLKKLLEGTPAPLPGIVLSTRDAPSSVAFTALEDILEKESDAPQRPSSAKDDVAVVIYTSGTTGRAKGVMLSHDNLISNITSANSWVGLTDADSILMVVPFYFIHGRMQIFTHALIGGTIVVSAGFQFPTVVLDEIKKHEVSGFSGVPYHFITLMDKTKLKSTALPKLRYVLVTGGALSLTGLDELRASLPAVDIHTAYGQTEASPRITYLNPQEMFVLRGCAGRPLPGVKVDILGVNEELLGVDEIGEVAASGPNIMKGYVSGDEVSSGRIDRQGRLRTGDLGRIDAAGYLWLAGRSSEMIKTAGERVFPKEIEDPLNTHPAIAECAVLAVKDEKLGERIVALIVLKPGATLTFSELRNHCLKSMSFVRVPREMKFIDQLPKTASGKLNRGQLPALLEAVLAQEAAPATAPAAPDPTPPVASS